MHSGRGPDSPSDPGAAVERLQERLSDAFDRFLEGVADNRQVAFDDAGWRLKTDSRTIRLADLLIEVENDLGFSGHFQQPGEKQGDPGEVRALLAAILAHSCNLGLYTMEKVAPDSLPEAEVRQRLASRRGEPARRARRHRPRHLPPRRRRGVSRDDAEAIRWYRRAAEQGNVLAQYNLGEGGSAMRHKRLTVLMLMLVVSVLVAHGAVAAQDPSDLAQLRRAAEQGNADAQNNLGNRYLFGRGVSQSNGAAFSWYRRAAEQGHAQAQAMVGVMYRDGRGVSQSDDAAVTWLRRAAEQGHAQAQVAVNQMEANDLRRAAEQGNADAQNNLGNRYLFGRGVSQSNGAAFSWYRRAAEQGHAQAQAMVGVMYRDGRGVSQSDDAAVTWLRRAAEQGHTQAQVTLNQIVAQQRAQAEQRAVQQRTAQQQRAQAEQQRVAQQRAQAEQRTQAAQRAQASSDTDELANMAAGGLRGFARAVAGGASGEDAVAGGILGALGASDGGSDAVAGALLSGALAGGSVEDAVAGALLSGGASTEDAMAGALLSGTLGAGGAGGGASVGNAVAGALLGDALGAGGGGRALLGNALGAGGLGNRNFGDDSGAYPNDGECDDGRFTGQGMGAASEVGKDASDCRRLLNAGRIRWRTR